jgi:hypothetical protein
MSNSNFHDVIKAEALKFARANAIAMPGDYVMTQWRDWKKPHRVQICAVGAALASAEFNKVKREFPATLEMFYCAVRLNADGLLRDLNGSGIVLTHFITETGITWKQSQNVINHGAVHWDLPESWPYVPAEEGSGP